MSEIVHVPFHGDDILTVEIAGKPHVVLKPALDNLGVDYWSQVEKLRTRSWATTSQCPVVAADGRTRDMVTCDIRSFLMLLATIDERRVAATVKPRLVTYQAEVADAIESYWTKGAAINPRLDLGKQAEVLDILRRGSGDQGWWEAKARQLVARALGESPEYDDSTRPLTVSVFLSQQGMTAADTRKHAGMFGKTLKAVYRTKFNADPPTIDDLVGRHMVPVAQYQEQHRPLFVEVWNSLGLGDAEVIALNAGGAS